MGPFWYLLVEHVICQCIFIRFLKLLHLQWKAKVLKLLHVIVVLIILYYKVHHWNQEEDETWRNIKDDTTITMMWILSSLLYFTHIYYQEYNALKSFQKALHVLCEENMIFSILGTSL